MRYSLALSTLACLLAPPTMAETLPSDLVRLEVLTGWRTAEGRHIAALRLTLASGWKTYWRAPGPAGLAPILDFSNSTGITAAEPRWPVPDLFEFNEMRSIGYHDAVTIPLDLSLDGRPARLAGVIDIGVCDTICVPVSFDFSADLPDVSDRDPVIVAALVDQPMTGKEAGAQAVCAVAPGADNLGLTVQLALTPLGPDEVVVIESGDPGLWISEAVSTRDGETLVATAEVLARDGGPPAIDRSRLRITVLGEGRAVEFQGCQAS
jgi:DsbC/DsbD-like thiol-disulfide interchange protein